MLVICLILLIVFDISVSLPLSQRSINKSFFEAPDITVSKNSKEGLDIAQKIADLFQDKDRPIDIDFPSKDGFETTQIASSGIKETSINFNFNIAVDVADGEITRIRLPHGDLLLLFIAADNRNRVNVNPIDFQDFLTKTIGTTHMASIPQNANKGLKKGIAFMSWAKPDEKMQEEFAFNDGSVSYNYGTSFKILIVK